MTDLNYSPTRLAALTKTFHETQWDYYFDDNYCDVLDKNNIWRVAKIIERDDDNVKLKYIRKVFTLTDPKEDSKWEQTNTSDNIAYDIELNITESQNRKLNHFRVVLKCLDNYSLWGNITNFENECDVDKLSELRSQIELFIANNDSISLNEFDCPLDILQILRGRIYFTWFNMINIKTESIPCDQLCDVVRSFLVLCQKYYQWVNSNISELELLNINSNFMLFDKSLACLSGLPEVSDLLKVILCNSRKDIIAWLDNNIGIINQISENINAVLINPNIPWINIIEWCSCFNNIVSNIHWFNKEQIDLIYNDMLARISALPEKYLKCLNIDGFMSNWFKITSFLASKECVDQLQWNFLYRWLISESLPLRIKGVTIVSKIVNQDFISTNSINNIIKTKDIISLLWGANTHEELIKRAAPIFIYANNNNLITNDIIINILNVSITHSTMDILGIAIEKLFLDISPVFTQEQNELIITTIKNIDFMKYNKKIVTFIQEIIYKTKNTKVLDVLWNYIIQVEINDNKLLDLCIKSIKNIIDNKLLDSTIIWNYLKMCLTNFSGIQTKKLFLSILQSYDINIEQELIAWEKENKIIASTFEEWKTFVNSTPDFNDKVTIYFYSLKVEQYLKIIFSFINYKEKHDEEVELKKEVLWNTWDLFMNNTAISDLNIYDAVINIFAVLLNNQFNCFYNIHDFIYSNMLNKINYATVSPNLGLYQFAIKIMINMNVKNKTMIYLNKDYARYGDCTQWKGIDLWFSFLTHARNETLLNLIHDKLYEIYWNPISIGNVEMNINNYQIYFDNIKDVLDRSSINCLRFLRCFIDRIKTCDEYFPISTLDKGEQTADAKEMKLIFGETNYVFKVNPKETTVYSVKEQVSICLKKPINFIVIYYSGVILDYNSDVKAFHEFPDLNYDDTGIIALNGNQVFKDNAYSADYLWVKNEELFMTLFNALGALDNRSEIGMSYLEVIEKMSVSKEVLRCIVSGDYVKWYSKRNTFHWDMMIVFVIDGYWVHESEESETVVSSPRVAELVLKIFLSHEYKNSEYFDSFAFISQYNTFLIQWINILSSITICKVDKDILMQCVRHSLKWIQYLFRRSLNISWLNFPDKDKLYQQEEKIVKGLLDFPGRFGDDYHINSGEICNEFIVFFSTWGFVYPFNHRIKKQVLNKWLNYNYVEDVSRIQHSLLNSWWDLTYLKHIESLVHENPQTKNTNNKSQDTLTSNSVQDYFRIIGAVINTVNIDNSILKRYPERFSFNLSELCSHFISYILSNIDHNSVIWFGYLYLLEKIASLNDDVRSSLKRDHRFFEYLFYKSLYFETGNCPTPTLFHDIKIRYLIYKIFISLCADNPHLMNILLSNWNDLNNARQRRSKFDWALKEIPERNGKFVGWINLGCTCYMNSLLQQIFTNKDLWFDIFLSQDNQNLCDRNTSLLYQLKLLMGSLSELQVKAHDPSHFFNQLTTFDNKPFKANEQMDVDEFYNWFLDRMEREYPDKTCNPFIKMFQGSTVNSVTCHGCPHESTRTEVFNSINVQVRNMGNIMSSLDDFFKDVILDGDNMFFCSECNEKRKAVKKIRIKTLPQCLVLLLKRFEFNYDTNRKIKINDYCEFYDRIDITDTLSDSHGHPRAMYKWGGFIVHKGTADSGHYYSVIQEQNTSKWLEFNDTIIKDYDPRWIEIDGFGAKNGFWNSTNNTSSAYVLFYYKDNNECIKHNPGAIQMKIPKDIKAIILEENKLAFLSRILYTNEYNLFFILLILNYNTETNKRFWDSWITKNNNVNKYPLDRDICKIISNNWRKLILPTSHSVHSITKSDTKNIFNETTIFKLYAKYVINIGLRTENKMSIPITVDWMKAWLNSNIENCIWFILNITSVAIIEELWIHCPNTEMKLICVGIIYCACLPLSLTLEKHPKNKEVLYDFIKWILSFVDNKYTNYMNDDLTFVYRLVLYFTKLSFEVTKYWDTELNYISLLRSFYFKKNSDDNSNNSMKYNSDLLNINYVGVSELTPNEMKYPQINDTNAYNANLEKLKQMFQRGNNTVNNNVHNTSFWISALVNIIKINPEHWSLFFDFDLAIALLLEANTRQCVSNWIKLFKFYSINQKHQALIKNISNFWIDLWWNIVIISDDFALKYLIYFYDLCLLSNTREWVNNIVKYWNMAILPNTRFYAFTIFNITNMIFIFTRNHQWWSEWNGENNGLWNRISCGVQQWIDWLLANPVGPKYKASSTTVYSKWRNHVFPVMVNPVEWKEYEEMCKIRTQGLVENWNWMLGMKLEMLKEEESLKYCYSTDDYSEYKFSEGDLVISGGVIGKVLAVLDEMLLVDYDYVNRNNSGNTSTNKEEVWNDENDVFEKNNVKEKDRKCTWIYVEDVLSKK